MRDKFTHRAEGEQYSFVSVMTAYRTVLEQTKNSIVEAISAEDIGAFPDASLGEAMQRIPGVTVTRTVQGGMGSGSELYTRNLLTYYRDVPQIAEWLSNVWEPEELQHGAALRAYVQTVWPEFDWHEAYRRFLAEYSQAASPKAFEATPQLELAARCGW